MIGNEMANFFNAHDAQAAVPPLFVPIIWLYGVDITE
jgi:hypothetical protein